MNRPPFHAACTRVAHVGEGDLFVPVPLDGNDQHYKIPEAVARGASDFLFEPGKFDPAQAPSARGWPVQCVRQALIDAAVARRAELPMRAAVVAGSFGKTSVKEMLGGILLAWSKSSGAIGHCSPANWNTKSQIAAQVLRLPEATALGVFEMGARKVGDFEIPLSVVLPEVGVLLNLGTAHLGEFGSLEALYATKLSLFGAPSLRTVVAPTGDARIFEAAKKSGKEIFSYGSSEETDLRLINAFDATEQSFRVLYRGSEEVLPLGWTGPGVIENALAAVSVALALGIDWPAIREGLANFQGVEGRFQAREWQGRLVIDDAFNASPESMSAGIRQFAQLSQDRPTKVLVLGPMLELGAESESFHASLGEWLAGYWTAQTPWLVTVGESAEIIGRAASDLGWKRWTHARSATEAQTLLEENSSEWSAAYLKGSRAVTLSNLFRAASEAI